MKKLNIIIGSKYGKWVVLEGERKVGIYRHILCCCNCGEKRFIRLNNLTSGESTGCQSCMRKTYISNNLNHGNSRKGKVSSEYISWFSMKARCYNENNNRYYIYGSRGIIVCERWKNSFENFLVDMGRKPTRFHTLDRKENNGNYEPKNCRWATKKEQANNRRPFEVSSIGVKELV